MGKLVENIGQIVVYACSLVVIFGMFWILQEVNNAQWDKVLIGIGIVTGSFILALVVVYRLLLPHKQVQKSEVIDTLPAPKKSGGLPDRKEVMDTLAALKKQGGLPDRKEVMEAKRLLKTPEELKAEAEDRARIKRNRANQQLKFEQAMRDQSKRIKHERCNAQNKLKQAYSRGKLSRVDAWKVVHGNISTCEHCGVVRLEDMHWHHLDPMTKVVSPSYLTKKVDPEGPFKTAIQQRNYDNAKAEVDKCILLCKHCHDTAEEHQH